MTEKVLGEYIIFENTTDKEILYNIQTDPNATFQTIKSGGVGLEASPSSISISANASANYEIAITQHNHIFIKPKKSEKVPILSPYVFITAMVKGNDGNYTTFFFNKLVHGGHKLCFKNKHLEARWFDPVPFDQIAFLDPSRTVISDTEKLAELEKEIERLQSNLAKKLELNKQTGDLGKNRQMQAQDPDKKNNNGKTDNNNTPIQPFDHNNSNNNNNNNNNGKIENRSDNSTPIQPASPIQPVSPIQPSSPNQPASPIQTSSSTKAPDSLGTEKAGIAVKIFGDSIDILKVSNKSSHKIIYFAIQSDVNATHVRKFSVSGSLLGKIIPSGGAKVDISKEYSRKKVVFSFDTVYNPLLVSPKEDVVPSKILFYDKKVHMAILIKEDNKFKMVQPFRPRDTSSEIIITDEDLECPENIPISSVKDLISTFNYTSSVDISKMIESKKGYIAGLQKMIEEQESILIDSVNNKN